MSNAARPTHLASIGLALLVTFLWSTSWILVRWGLDDEALDPMGFAALRYGLAALVLLGWTSSKPAIRRQVRHLDRAVLRQMFLLGVVFYAVTQGAQFIAIDQQPAATTSLVLSATPLLVAMISNRSLAEPPTNRQLSGGILVLVGASLYFSGALAATLIGMIAAVVGLVANATGSVLGRSVNRSTTVPPVLVTTLSMTIGAAVLMVASLAVEGWPSVTLRAWFIIAWLAIVNTAMAFTWWNMSLRNLSATESAGINNTMLLQIALLGWWLLDERPGTAGLAGIAIVSVGVLLTQTKGSDPFSIVARRKSGSSTGRRRSC